MIYEIKTGETILKVKVSHDSILLVSGTIEGEAIDPDQITIKRLDRDLNYPKLKKKLRCDVCGSTDISENPHMGRNCNWCNPLTERSSKP